MFGLFRNKDKGSISAGSVAQSSSDRWPKQKTVPTMPTVAPDPSYKLPTLPPPPEVIKLNAIANEVMDAFQKRGLTNQEVRSVLMKLTVRLDEKAQRVQKEMEGQAFTPIHF